MACSTTPRGRNAPVIADFVQKIPVEGGAAERRDGSAAAVRRRRACTSARGSSVADPSAIRTSITRRDGDSDAEVFTVSLDPYLDRRTAYSFSISSGGVRGDVYHSQDSEDSGREAQFDPDLERARARRRRRLDRRDAHSVLAAALQRGRRSRRGDSQLTRNVADKSERMQWVLIPVSAAGFASHFGRLEGIAGIPPARRLELMPYVAGDLTYRANVNPRNPFDDKLGARAGGDLKYGLGPNLTLDATINPDFGQVEADPAVVNLTAFETIFEERRPFFIEGNELLTGRGQSFIGRPSWFYSRRIGAAPRGFGGRRLRRRADEHDDRVGGEGHGPSRVAACRSARSPRSRRASTRARSTRPTIVRDAIAVEPPSVVRRAAAAAGVRHAAVERRRVAHARAALARRSRRARVAAAAQRGRRRRRLAAALHAGHVRDHGLGRRQPRGRRRRRDRAAAARERALLPAPRPGSHHATIRRARR